MLILVPVDYSAASDTALRIAAGFARRADGKLLVLHLLRFTVYELAEFPGFASGGRPDDAGGMMLGDETTRLREHVTRVLEAEGAPPSYEIDVDWGSPHLQIVEVAIDRNVDLIVMGTHGRTGIKHALLGSVAEKTVRLGPCPVLTVHADADRRIVQGGVTEQAASLRVVGDLVRGQRPATIGPDDSLAEAVLRMRRAQARHLPVVDGERLVGFLSDRDIPAHFGQLERTRVHVAMTAEPVTVSVDDDAESAARLMLDNRVRALPVLDGPSLVGVVSTSDILEDYVQAARY